MLSGFRVKARNVDHCLFYPWLVILKLTLIPHRQGTLYCITIIALVQYFVLLILNILHLLCVSLYSSIIDSSLGDNFYAFQITRYSSKLSPPYKYGSHSPPCSEIYCCTMSIVDKMQNILPLTNIA